MKDSGFPTLLFIFVLDMRWTIKCVLDQQPLSPIQSVTHQGHFDNIATSWWNTVIRGWISDKRRLTAGVYSIALIKAHIHQKLYGHFLLLLLFSLTIRGEQVRVMGCKYGTWLAAPAILDLGHSTVLKARDYIVKVIGCPIHTCPSCELFTYLHPIESSNFVGLTRLETMLSDDTVEMFVKFSTNTFRKWSESN